MDYANFTVILNKIFFLEASCLEKCVYKRWGSFDTELFLTGAFEKNMQ